MWTAGRFSGWAGVLAGGGMLRFSVARIRAETGYMMFAKEPILIFLAGVDAAVVAVLSAATVLGFISLSGTELAAVSAAVVAVTGLIGSVLRALVYSPAEHENRVSEALYTSVPGDDLGGSWSRDLEGL